MKIKQLLKCIIFCFVFVYLMITLTYILRTSGDVKERFCGFYNEAPNQIDVVMIGSSPVAANFIPQYMWNEFGFTTTLLSTNRQHPKAIKFLIEEVQKYQNPEVYLIEMRMFGSEDEYLYENEAFLRGVTDNLKYSLNRNRTINSLIAEEDKFSYYFDIAKYHSNWKTLILPSQFLRFRYEYPDVNKGYSYVDEIFPFEMNLVLDEERMEPMPLEQETVLRDLIEYLRVNEIEAKFVLSPWNMDRDMRRVFNYIENIIENEGFDYIDMNDNLDEIGINPQTDFYDGGAHENVFGAVKCSQYLGQYLETQYKFDGIKKQKTSKEWDEAFTVWSEKYQKSLQKLSE